MTWLALVLLFGLLILVTLLQILGKPFKIEIIHTYKGVTMTSTDGIVEDKSTENAEEKQERTFQKALEAITDALEGGDTSDG